ncbi:MFS transporter [Brevibacillus reuszeri]|uniref:MFS transporter n=1 Tax=Brevibacillus reuszeri TaxID=54915 RepID=UPI001B1613A6|nr:MFS transporter [Brevibacillus reuszeri]GIO04816.1 MFS transporter [Brevibacillus reuszeri]
MLQKNDSRRQFKDFRTFWLSHTATQFGAQVALLGLPLVASLSLAATPLQMGVLGALEYAPFLLIGLFAGVWVDRSRRRPVLFLSNMGRALLLALIPILSAIGVLRMEWLYTIAFLTGVCTVFFDIAYQSYLPTLVSKEQLVGTNSMLEGSRSAAQMTGPGLSGVLIQMITAPMAMLVTSLSFFLSALSLSFIKKEEALPVRPDTPRSLWQDIREGLQLSFSEPLLFGVIRCSAIFNFSWNVMFSVYVLYAITTLHISSGWLGLVYGGMGVGFFLGALLVHKAIRTFGMGPVIVGSAMIASSGGPFAPLAMGSGSSAVFLLMLGQFFFGLGMSMWSISTLSLRQAIVPDQLQGRVNATVRFVAWGAYPLGSLAGGIIGDRYGMQIALFAGAAGLMIAALTLFFTPFLKSKEKTMNELHRG